MSLVGMLLSVCVCLGAAIGLRFRVYALVLAVVAVAATLVTFGLAADRFSLAMLGEVAASMIALQVGYVSGVLARMHLHTARGHATGAPHLTALAPRFSDQYPD